LDTTLAGERLADLRRPSSYNRDLWELLIAQNDRHRITWLLVEHPERSPLAARALVTASAQR
jgi:hypothetical protein